MGPSHLIFFLFQEIKTMFIVRQTDSQTSAIPDGNVQHTSLVLALGPQSLPLNGHMVEV